MKLSDYRLDNLPLWAQIALFGLLAAGLSGVFYVFYLKGLLEQREALSAEVKKLEISVAQASAVASQLERFKAEVAELEERLKVLRSILPSQKETPTVLRSVQRMAASSDLKINKFIPRPLVPRAFYVDWPIGMEVEGSYDGLGYFFERISQFTRIVNVDNISIKAIEGSTDSRKTVTAACTATTFVFREDETAKTVTK